jgi:hypothetical protein
VSLACLTNPGDPVVASSLLTLKERLSLTSSSSSDPLFVDYFNSSFPLYLRTLRHDLIATNKEERKN